MYNVLRVVRCKKTTPRGDTRFRWQSVGRSSNIIYIIIMNYDITNLVNGLGRICRASRAAGVHLLKANVLEIV